MRSNLAVGVESCDRDFAIAGTEPMIFLSCRHYGHLAIFPIKGKRNTARSVYHLNSLVSSGVLLCKVAKTSKTSSALSAPKVKG